MFYIKHCSWYVENVCLQINKMAAVFVTRNFSDISCLKLFNKSSYCFLTEKLGTCKSFFFIRIESRFESAVRFVFGSNRPYTTQAVTQPNGLQAYRTACYRPIICWRLALWTCVLYLIHRYFVFVTNKSDVRPTKLRTEYLFISVQS